MTSEAVSAPWVAGSLEELVAGATDRVAVRDLLRRAVVLHVGADNLGNIPVGDAPTQYEPNSPEATSLTARTGNAGDRLACGVITARR